jgi:hypothetical protein
MLIIHDIAFTNVRPVHRIEPRKISVEPISWI